MHLCPDELGLVGAVLDTLATWFPWLSRMVNALRTRLRWVAVEVRWWLRGVTMEDYRTTCARCGRTGQAHLEAGACRRFIRPENQTTWCWCPGCGRDLVSQPDALQGLEHPYDYVCACGTMSRWAFDRSLLPVLVTEDRDESEGAG